VSEPRPIDAGEVAASLEFLANRTPATSADEAAGSFARLADYRDGGVFVASFAGRSEWERHTRGDELVMVLSGEARLSLLLNGAEKTVSLGQGELLVVPAGTWHRFETDGVELLTVTPQPTDHHRGPALPES
jgi:quercetin dioxygenase-like cupin family protein